MASRDDCLPVPVSPLQVLPLIHSELHKPAPEFLGWQLG